MADSHRSSRWCAHNWRIHSANICYWFHEEASQSSCQVDLLRASWQGEKHSQEDVRDPRGPWLQVRSEGARAETVRSTNLNDILFHCNTSSVICLKFDAISICRISSPESISDEITRKCESIFPLRDVYIRKVKVLKKPKFDLTKLMELHGTEGAEDTGVKLDKIAAENTVKALAGAGGRL